MKHATFGWRRRRAGGGGWSGQERGAPGLWVVVGGGPIRRGGGAGLRRQSAVVAAVAERGVAVRAEADHQRARQAGLVRHDAHAAAVTALLHTTFTQPPLTPSSGVVIKNGKVFPYSLPSVGPGADPGVQAVSPQVT